MIDWRRDARRLSEVDKLKDLMNSNILRNPDFYRKRMNLLDDFFSANSSPVDIAIVLYGGLSDAHHLAFHISGNNLLFYRPKASHKRLIKDAFLEGRMYTNRTLLIFDQDMVSGSAMIETASFFHNAGYERSKIFGYLDEGCKWRQYNTPELMHVDDLLKK